MIDFAISPSGDLIFEEAEEAKRFKLSFRLAKSRGLNVKFSTEKQKRFASDAPLKITFNTGEIFKRHHRAKLVLEQEHKLQMLKIALQTERGELEARSNIGSRLSVVKHGNLYDENNLRQIEEYVKEAISGILSSPEVVAKPEKGVGNFYSQTVGVYIYEKGILIFKFFI